MLISRAQRVGTFPLESWFDFVIANTGCRLKDTKLVIVSAP